MIVVVLGVLTGIAYLVWTAPSEKQARRIPVRVRDENPKRRRR
ncbi:MAG: hypothetical protein AB8B85_01265 [Paracoccaceae bacterium]